MRASVKGWEPEAPGEPDGVAGAADGALSFVVRTVNRAFARALQLRIAQSGVSMGQWFFLRALWDEDGLTQRELSHRVGMMEPTTVTAVNVMESQGLVQRVRNSDDRRKMNIFLTERGRALRDAMMPTADEINEIAIQGIDPDDLARTLDVLRRVGANLNAASSSSFGSAAIAGDGDFKD
ncbi:MarR family winged helix-turn-helix transcriptional regulator [Azospirillum picis]|uniref:DNA-binding MarR family transcriptional regulator n=1 Tax=Azospirillum picis TaxID=488438 RepID=A0ABU0MGL7_9PROT|nr:MarR family winged helix-turn-helix transcriptional regulator [Azospirillum picis]MBP2298361.1 DNA-binding MarR family transcriptional regulator [Azospirillum picis]MDQ0532590.1 DNA-binding MarR family transcriptional regulator [Azospirillum picis]